MSGTASAFFRQSSGDPDHEMRLSKVMFSKNGFRRFCNRAVGSLGDALVFLIGSAAETTPAGLVGAGGDDEDV
jgi:hypothetical protein